MQSPVGDTFSQCASAGSQLTSAEPFAAPSPQAARVLPLAVDSPAVCTPATGQHAILAVMSETPVQKQLAKRRVCA